ncbi:hypothetical protein LTR66_017687 [Elasticomyces elasticus]|nr:hypothetical protein LTR66_017687 [Elasticomyces elasticus]
MSTFPKTRGPVPLMLKTPRFEDYTHLKTNLLRNKSKIIKHKSATPILGASKTKANKILKYIVDEEDKENQTVAAFNDVVESINLAALTTKSSSTETISGHLTDVSPAAESFVLEDFEDEVHDAMATLSHMYPTISLDAIYTVLIKTNGQVFWASDILAKY